MGFLAGHRNHFTVSRRASTIVAKIITCSFSARELISDYSYSRVVAADKNIHKYNTTSQNMTHFITLTHHTNPHIPTSVVFLDDS